VVDRGVAESGRHTAGLPEPAPGEVVIRRTSTGWRVEGTFPTLPTDTVDDIGHALVLADLLADEIVPGPRPPRPPGDLDEVARLRASVRQLEHALSSRVVVEQAIGVLSERWRVAPRDAFERLRRVTRSHGLRIHDLAKLVIESSTDPDIGLPDELFPLQRGADGPPGPRQSPDGRRRGDGRSRRNRSGDPAAAQTRSEGGRTRVQAMPAPRSSNGRHAHSR
jgi:ANTAR domain